MMISCDLRDTRSRWIGTSQGRTSFVQPPQQDVSGRTYAQEFGATHPQRSLGHADLRTKCRHVEPLINTPAQNLFEPNHHCSMMVPCAAIVLRLVGNETIDDRMKQLVFQRPCDLGTFNQPSAVFRQITCLSEEVLEFDRFRARSTDYSALARHCDRLARQCLVATGQALVRKRYQAPLARTVEALMQGFAAAVKNHATVSDSNPGE